MPATSILHGDKGYDSDAVRRKIEAKGAAPNIPPKINRRWKSCFSPVLYRDRKLSLARDVYPRNCADRYCLTPLR